MCYGYGYGTCCDAHVRRYDRDTGEVVWRWTDRKAKGEVCTDLSVRAGHGYLLALVGGRVSKVRLADGVAEWAVALTRDMTEAWMSDFLSGPSTTEVSPPTPVEVESDTDGQHFWIVWDVSYRTPDGVDRFGTYLSHHRVSDGAFTHWAQGLSFGFVNRPPKRQLSYAGVTSYEDYPAKTFRLLTATFGRGTQGSQAQYNDDLVGPFAEGGGSFISSTIEYSLSKLVPPDRQRFPWGTRQPETGVVGGSPHRRLTYVPGVPKDDSAIGDDQSDRPEDHLFGVLIPGSSTAQWFDQCDRAENNSDGRIDANGTHLCYPKAATPDGPVAEMVRIGWSIETSIDPAGGPGPVVRVTSPDRVWPLPAAYDPVTKRTDVFGPLRYQGPQSYYEGFAIAPDGEVAAAFGPEAAGTPGRIWITGGDGWAVKGEWGKPRSAGVVTRVRWGGDEALYVAGRSP